MKTLHRLADDHARLNVLVPLLLGLLAVGRPLLRALERRAPSADARPERRPASEAVLYALLGCASLTRGLESRLAALLAEPPAAPPDPSSPDPPLQEILR